MSYAPLLRSLASTPRGDWRVVAGTLLRQAFNEGLLSTQAPPAQRTGESQRAEARRTGLSLYRVRQARGASTGKGPGVRARHPGGLSATRFVRDLRSVGWGASESAVRTCYRITVSSFVLPVTRTCQARSDLMSFHKPAPAGWVKPEPRNQRDAWISYALLIENIGGGNVSVKLTSTGTRGTEKTILTSLEANWEAWHQSRPELIELDYPEGETGYNFFETLEYAGTRHLTRGITTRRKTVTINAWSSQADATNHWLFIQVDTSWRRRSLHL